jgi:uncharacterized protein YjbI with pentapeptide repeats
MLPEKPVKPTKSSFTDEQIRVKAYQLWEKNKEQSPEESWYAAVKALEREKFWRPLMSVWRWTGIGEKKGWDIVTGLSLPLIVFGGGILFNYLNGQQQQKIAEEKQKDELLKTYINDMKASLLDREHPLKDLKKNGESRSIARTITLTTLTQLNSEQDQQKAKEGKYNQRKGLIMQFLYESGLIKFAPKVDSIISLKTADFTFADFYNAYLESANLIFANLNHANLKRANLKRANLKSSNLEGTNLKGAKLQFANLESAYLYNAYLYNAYLYNAYLSFANLESAYLYNAYLENANLSFANLESAYLKNAYLENANLKSAYLKNANLQVAKLQFANLKGANLSFANLSFAYLSFAYLESTNLESAYLESANLYNTKNLTNKQIKSACFWEKAIYTEFAFDETKGWIAKDPEANQKRIDEIKQDKASDPLMLPDCSMWKYNFPAKNLF